METLKKGSRESRSSKDNLEAEKPPTTASPPAIIKNDRAGSTDFSRICPSKLTRRELEDLYYNVLQKNIELKKTLNKQTEKLRTMNTKIQRLSKNPKEAKDCCNTKTLVTEQRESISELRKANEKLTDRIRQLNHKITSTKQFLKHPLASRSKINTVNNQNGKSTSVSGLNLTNDVASQWMLKDNNLTVVVPSIVDFARDEEDDVTLKPESECSDVHREKSKHSRRSDSRPVKTPYHTASGDKQKQDDKHIPIDRNPLSEKNSPSHTGKDGKRKNFEESPYRNRKDFKVSRAVTKSRSNERNKENTPRIPVFTKSKSGDRNKDVKSPRSLTKSSSRDRNKINKTAGSNDSKASDKKSPRSVESSPSSTSKCPKDTCDANKCRTAMDDMKKKIEELNQELKLNRGEYADRIAKLEQEVIDLHGENLRVVSESHAREHSGERRDREARAMADQLRAVQGQCADLKTQLSIEKAKVAEMETQLKADNFTNQVAKTIQLQLANKDFPRTEISAEAGGNSSRRGSITGDTTPAPEKRRRSKTSDEPLRKGRRVTGRPESSNSDSPEPQATDDKRRDAPPDFTATPRIAAADNTENMPAYPDKPRLSKEPGINWEALSSSTPRRESIAGDKDIGSAYPDKRRESRLKNQPGSDEESQKRRGQKDDNFEDLEDPNVRRLSTTKVKVPRLSLSLAIQPEPMHKSENHEEEVIATSEYDGPAKARKMSLTPVKSCLAPAVNTNPRRQSRSAEKDPNQTALKMSEPSDGLGSQRSQKYESIEEMPESGTEDKSGTPGDITQDQERPLKVENAQDQKFGAGGVSKAEKLDPAQQSSMSFDSISLTGRLKPILESNKSENEDFSKNKSASGIRAPQPSASDSRPETCVNYPKRHSCLTEELANPARRDSSPTKYPLLKAAKSTTNPDNEDIDEEDANRPGMTDPRQARPDYEIQKSKSKPTRDADDDEIELSSQSSSPRKHAGMPKNPSTVSSMYNEDDVSLKKRMEPANGRDSDDYDFQETTPKIEDKKKDKTKVTCECHFDEENYQDKDCKQLCEKDKNKKKKAGVICECPMVNEKAFGVEDHTPEDFSHGPNSPNQNRYRPANVSSSVHESTPQPQSTESYYKPAVANGKALDSTPIYDETSEADTSGRLEPGRNFYNDDSGFVEPNRKDESKYINRQDPKSKENTEELMLKIANLQNELENLRLHGDSQAVGKKKEFYKTEVPEPSQVKTPSQIKLELDEPEQNEESEYGKLYMPHRVDSLPEEVEKIMSQRQFGYVKSRSSVTNEPKSNQDANKRWKDFEMEASEFTLLHDIGDESKSTTMAPIALKDQSKANGTLKKLPMPEPLPVDEDSLPNTIVSEILLRKKDQTKGKRNSDAPKTSLNGGPHSSFEHRESLQIGLPERKLREKKDERIASIIAKSSDADPLFGEEMPPMKRNRIKSDLKSDLNLNYGYLKEVTASSSPRKLSDAKQSESWLDTDEKYNQGPAKEAAAFGEPVANSLSTNNGQRQDGSPENALNLADITPTLDSKTESDLIQGDDQMDICERLTHICLCPHGVRKDVAIFRSCSGTLRFRTTSASGSKFRKCKNCCKPGPAANQDSGTQTDFDNGGGMPNGYRPMPTAMMPQNNKKDNEVQVTQTQSEEYQAPGRCQLMRLEKQRKHVDEMVQAAPGEEHTQTDRLVQSTDSQPRTYVINQTEAKASSDNTDAEISSMTDLPTEKDMTTNTSNRTSTLSPGEQKMSSYTDAYTMPTDYGWLSEGEVPTDRGKVDNKQKENTPLNTAPTNVDATSSAKMEQALAAIGEELARCRKLILQTQSQGSGEPPKTKDATASADMGPGPIALRKTEGKPRIGDTFTPKCLFTLHIGTIVLSDEAVINSRDMSLMLLWQFYDQDIAMTRMRAGRVVHFDFSTEYEIKLTEDFLEYLKQEEMPIKICELGKQDSPFASCSLPLRDALLHINKRADMSLALVAGPNMQRGRLTADALDAGDEVGVLDLWCMLRVDPNLMTTLNKSIAKNPGRNGLRPPNVPIMDDNNDDIRLSADLDFMHKKKNDQPTELSEIGQMHQQNNNKSRYGQGVSPVYPTGVTPSSPFQRIPDKDAEGPNSSSPYRGAHDKYQERLAEAMKQGQVSFDGRNRLYSRASSTGIIINEVPANIKSTNEMKMALEKNIPARDDDPNTMSPSMLSVRSFLGRKPGQKEKQRLSLSVCSQDNKSCDTATEQPLKQLDQEDIKESDMRNNSKDTISSNNKKYDHNKFLLTKKAIDAFKRVKIKQRAQQPTSIPEPETAEERADKYLDKIHSQSLDLTVLWLALNEECEAMANPEVQRLYVAYSFLGRTGAELETPVSLPKPKQYQDKCHFDFKKTFQLTNGDLHRLGRLALYRCPQKGPYKAKECVVFTVVSEPTEDPLALRNCEDIGYAHLYFGDLLAYSAGSDTYTEVIPVLSALNLDTVCGVLAIKHQAASLPSELVQLINYFYTANYNTMEA